MSDHPTKSEPGASPAPAPAPPPPAVRPQDDTPAMRQYHRFKKQHPECVLFFRIGDFYEMFYDDARLAHKVMGVTLTQRTEGIPMAGVPYHAVEGYLRRMIQAGHRVAVCEQIEDPNAPAPGASTPGGSGKGIIDREVTRVITPGTLTDESLLEEGRENPLAAVVFLAEGASVAWAELSTGAFHLATFAPAELADELARIAPSELLYVETADARPPTRIKDLVEPLGCAAAGRPGWQFRLDDARQTLCRQFGVASLAGFGLTDDDPAIGPAGAIVAYLLETQRSRADLVAAKRQANAGPNADPNGAPPLPRSLSHLQPPQRFVRSDHLVIDQVSLRSLEVERTMRSGGADGSLLGVLQDCVTAMGKRTLRNWLCYPLCRREPIVERQRMIAALVDDAALLDALRATLGDVQDVQRILARIAVGRATPRDLVALGRASAQARPLALLLADRPWIAGYHARLAAAAAPLSALSAAIAAACVDAPPHHLREGGLIRDGFDARLDESRGLQRDSHTWLASYQKSLIDSTGIPSLKVGFNKIFGYYIELSAAQRDKAPPEWSRKQTLKNAERFITPDLKDFEGKVLTAEQRAVAREGELFFELCTAAQNAAGTLQAFADAVAELDVLACLARRAARFRYVCPTIVDAPVLQIRAGRHPVLDEILGDQFVPNDVALGREPDGAADPAASSNLGHTLGLITGPNMAGKSTYIRQAALLTLLAHTGSFVPAEAAVIGLCDRIFTRIGASDELHAGQSTFMVEMTETSNICHHATPRSLVILDEIGRGTSTLDGLSLAWAIAEHLADRACRTLFATHYHELTALAQRFANVVNLNVTVREWQEQIVFLHRIVPGSADRSYGIHVAKIAGLPHAVVHRANELLSQLEVNHNSPAAPRPKSSAPRAPDPQMSLFTEYLPHPVVASLRGMDIEKLSPLQAFDALRRLRDQATTDG
ncbi:MAG: DNA mismatch repair protein MutS [Planctomycetota bacterium]|nr:DNA mismatch repair protein MutS [Planctomycetota bacterium]